MKKLANRIISREENRLISEALDEMVLSLKVGRRTEKTIRFYVANIGRFGWWLEEGHKKLNLSSPVRIDDIETTHIRLFLQYLQTNQRRWASRDNHESNKPLKDASVQAYFRALRAFFAFCEREQFIEANPFDDKRLRTPKVTQKIVPHYSDDEIVALLDACRSDEWDHLRDYAIILLLLDTGIRAEELCGLRLDDVQPERVKVLGKGQKERYLPLSAPTEKAIRDYKRKERPAGGEHLFVGKGTQGLSYDGLKSMLRRRRKQVGIEDATLHKFRRTFAVKFLKAGGGLNHLQAILGHTSPIMSMRYGMIASTESALAHQQFSPVDRLLKKR